MDNTNLYKFNKSQSIDYLGFLLIGFIIFSNFYIDIPENIKNLILKYQYNPKALSDNQEIKDFAYSKYNEIKETFNELKNNYENSKISEG